LLAQCTRKSSGTMSAKKADDIAALKQAENEAADIVRAAREGMMTLLGVAVARLWQYHLRTGPP
jgi:hypothetical protein